jgi:hypothetical protein
MLFNALLLQDDQQAHWPVLLLSPCACMRRAAALAAPPHP